MRNAFVLRIKPSGVDRVPEALQTGEVIIGWSDAEGLLDPNLDWKQFRQIIHDAYHQTEQSYNRSGGAAGHMWRFVRDMNPGDWVVVPYGNEFFVAEVQGHPRYDPGRKREDTAYRRSVSWLNRGESIPRRYARAALQSRMKTQGTCARAADLVEEIENAIQAAGVTEAPTFENDLRLTLVNQAMREIRSGLIDSYGFEHLVATVLKSLGASEVRILSRSHEDKGADIIAHFPLATTFRFALAVQAKHYQPEPPIGAETVDQLVRGMEAEGTDLGWVVTSGTYSEEAMDRKTAVEEDLGFRIELVDGEQLAAMIVEGGLREVYG